MLSRSCRNISRNFSANRGNGQALVTVWWDSSCPLCTKEISLLKRLDKQNNIDFIDLFQSDNPYAMVNGCPVDKKELLSRFHALERGGSTVSGAAAFAALWRNIPALRWLGLIAQNERVLSLLEWLYIKFLKYRPMLQKLVK